MHRLRVRFKYSYQGTPGAVGMNEAIARRPAADYWVVSVCGLLWNGMTCLDFALTITRNAAYLSKYPRDVIDWLDSAPTWTAVPWAIGAWGGLAGSLLLLARSRHAVPAFALSFAGLMIFLAWELYVGPPPSVDIRANISTTAAIRIVSLALWIFAIVKRRQGVLR